MHPRLTPVKRGPILKKCYVHTSVKYKSSQLCYVGDDEQSIKSHKNKNKRPARGSGDARLRLSEGNGWANPILSPRPGRVATTFSGRCARSRA
ncbi:hypothetical protein EVAR_95936_1 [Eumeta japonica]|uniref:Uncharacterized protein n=1 Tax=Eumeta variegata TaxID=151549 RepID=A0A4C1V8Y0_EUMVA|nr:hypothetical protein EVAR_95936_1 [Eumeta japonica]